MATITGNYVYADPTQWWTLDYTFANSKFTWSVTAHASFTSYWNSIYGLTVNIGGNSYYKGDIDWRNYSPNTVVYYGETPLSACTVQNGVVTLSVSGNFYFGTWSSDYRSSGSGTCAVDPPTVATLSTPSITNQYSGMTVAGRSVITFRMKGTSQTGSTTMSYSLYQDGSVISTSTGTSGQNKDVTVTAPSAGSHTYKYVATDGNGTTTTSGNISITTYAYTPPAFSSVSAVRWSTGNSSGTASDEGTYCKATANFSQGKVGTTAITTTCTIKVDTYTGTATNGTAIWLGGGNLSADNTYSVTFTLSDGYGNNVVTTDTLTQGGRGIDLIYGNGHYGVALGQKATANQFDVNMATFVNGTVTANNVVSKGSAYITVSGNYPEINFTGGGGSNRGGAITKYTTTSNNQFYIQHFHRSGGVNSTSYVDQYWFPKAGTDNAIHSYDVMTTNPAQVGVVTNAVTRTSGWAITTQRLVTWGKLAQLSLYFTMPSSGTGYTGNRAFNGSIASGYRPYYTTTGMGFLTPNSSGSHSFGGYIDNVGEIVLAYQDDITFSGGTAYISFTYILGV